MATDTRPWTLDDLHRLPDDGNKYELVRGELFVTPAPSVGHEEVLARLTALLVPYVTRHSLGRIYHPRAVLRFEGSEFEPDLMVRPAYPRTLDDWAKLPTPILVVEVLSATTRRRDVLQKRALYIEAGVPEYWIVDAEALHVRVVRSGVADVIASDVLEWRPAGPTEPCVIPIAALFGE